MALKHVRIHPDAIAEAQAATLWYRNRSPSAADAFLVELDKAVEAITENHETWPGYVQGTRRYFFHRFPFYLVYREAVGDLEIIAVAHGRRKPGYWKNRTVSVSIR